MVALLVLLLLSQPLEPPFVEASTTAVSTTDDDVQLDVRLEIAGAPEVVLAQPYGPDLAPFGPAVPMSRLEDGTWGTLLTLPRRSAMRLGFEILDGTARERSNAHTLVELGVDPAIFQDPVEGPREREAVPPRERVTAWAWLALMAGVGAITLGVLAFWPRRDEDEAPEAIDAGSDLDENRSGSPEHTGNADH